MNTTEEELKSIDLNINHSKTYQINFSTKNIQPQNELAYQKVSKEVLKLLTQLLGRGLQIDNILTWNKHTKLLINKLLLYYILYY